MTSEKNSADNADTFHSEMDAYLGYDMEHDKTHLIRRFNKDKMFADFSSPLPEEIIIHIASFIHYDDDDETIETLLNFMEWCQPIISPKSIIIRLQQIKSPVYKLIHDFLIYMKFFICRQQIIPECFGDVCGVDMVRSNWHTMTFKTECMCWDSGYDRCDCGHRKYTHITRTSCMCGIARLSIEPYSDERNPLVILCDESDGLCDYIPTQSEKRIGYYVARLTYVLY
jgi:hypothetical protein